MMAQLNHTKGAIQITCDTYWYFYPSPPPLYDIWWHFSRPAPQPPLHLVWHDTLQNVKLCP